MTKIFVSFCFLLVIIIKCADCYTVQFLSNEQKNDNSFIQSQQFYRKFQEPTLFSINGESDTYAKVTGFTIAFSHTEPVLYKIKFDAICYNPWGGMWVFPRIMVNDQLIYNDKLIKNTPNRYKLIPGYNDIFSLDHIGVGQYAFFSTMAMAITKSELIYLQPGLHVIDVAVRAIGVMPVNIYNGVLTIELVRFRKGANIGDMILMNGTSINIHG